MDDFAYGLFAGVNLPIYRKRLDSSIRSAEAQVVATTREYDALRDATLDDVVDSDPDAFGGPIELLAKRLDCAQPLSVQVHPKTGDPKTEAWVVLEAESGAGVYHGFAESVDAGAVRAATEEGTLRALLRFVPVLLMYTRRQPLLHPYQRRWRRHAKHFLACISTVLL